MSRYPTRDGLAIPITELGYSQPDYRVRHLTSNHHLQFEKRQYQDERYKQIFRGLFPRVPVMWVSEHLDLHQRFSAPPIPSKFVMIDTVEEYLAQHGVIDVVCEQKTNEHYQVTQQQWDRIIGRNGHRKN